MRVLGIDPGSAQSAYVVYADGLIKNASIEPNLNMKHIVSAIKNVDHVAIEMIASYGMPVGKEVFETVLWIGRFMEAAMAPVTLVYRKDIKVALCGSTKAKDGNIRQALIDRLGAQGVKKSPGPTYGIKADEWSALAVAVYFWDTMHPAMLQDYARRNHLTGDHD